MFGPAMASRADKVPGQGKAVNDAWKTALSGVPAGRGNRALRLYSRIAKRLILLLIGANPDKSSPFHLISSESRGRYDGAQATSLICKTFES
jgi:hypothetical protein